jgi:hypothetical protein
MLSVALLSVVLLLTKYTPKVMLLIIQIFLNQIKSIKFFGDESQFLRQYSNGAMTLVITAVNITTLSFFRQSLKTQQ